MILFALLIVVCIITNLWLLSALLTFLFSLIFFNLLIVRKMRKETKKFTPYSQVRNVNFLIIGDMCDAKKLVQSDSYIQISAPGRGLKASYEVLRHTFSILQEHKGAVIVVTKKSNIGGYSVFDIPYFNKITIKRLHIESLNRMLKITLFVSPVKAIRYFFGICTGKLCDTACPPKEIVNFCQERNLNLIFKQLL